MPKPPELPPWPPGPSQRLCCSRPPQARRAEGLQPFVRLPAQGLHEMREIVSPGRRPPAPAALPFLHLRFPVDVLLQGSALPPCPRPPPAVPASPRPGPPQLGSVPWLDQLCPDAFHCTRSALGRGGRGSGPPGSLAAQGCLPRRCPPSGVPRDRWSGLNLVGQTLYSAVSGFGGMEGQGPTSSCLPAAALASREPQEEMGAGAVAVLLAC